MFGIFDSITDTVENVVDVGLGIVSLGEYGDFSKRTVSRMIADGIEIAVIAHEFGVAEDLVRSMIDD